VVRVAARAKWGVVALVLPMAPLAAAGGRARIASGSGTSGAACTTTGRAMGVMIGGGASCALPSPVFKASGARAIICVLLDSPWSIRKIRKSLRGLNDLNLWLSSLSQLSMLILCLVNFRLSNGNQASSSSSYLSVDKLQKDESTSKCMF